MNSSRWLSCTLALLFILSPLSLAQISDPTPRQEELAARLLAEKGTPTLAGMAWHNLTEQDRKQITKIVEDEKIELEDIKSLETDLKALLNGEPISVHVTSNQQFRFSQKVSDEIIGRVVSFLNKPAQEKSNVEGQLQNIAKLQVTPDPRSFYHLNSKPYENQTQADRLDRLADLFLFGLEQAAQKNRAGDIIGAKEFASASLRALVEAYLTIGRTPGRQQALFQTAAVFDALCAMAVYMASIATVSYTHNFKNPGFLTLVPISIGLFVVYFRDLAKRDQASYGVSLFNLKEYEKPPAQPFLLPTFLRDRILRQDALRRLQSFWNIVKIKTSFLAADNNLSEDVLALLQLDKLSDYQSFAPVDLNEAEQWAVKSLSLAGANSIETLAHSACERFLMTDESQD